MLELVGVVAGDAGAERLNRCALTVRPGEILGVVGPTGAGKTTLLEVMAGHRAPSKGRLVWEGREVTRSPDRLRAVTGLVGHEVPGPRGATVSAWLALFAELDAAPGGWREKRTEQLARFELTGVAERPVETLSRGQARRLSWARQWLRHPRVLLLDGPEEGVDGAGLRILTQWIKDTSAAGGAVVFTSVAPHFPTLLCDRVLVLQAGAVTQEHARATPGFGPAVAAAQGWAS